MSSEKNFEMNELSLDQLDKVSGGNIEEDAQVVTVIARKTITAANGPGEVGDLAQWTHEPFEAVAVFPAGTEINVYIDYQMNGYIYSNSLINPFMGSAYQFFYVKLDDVTIK